MTKGIFPSSLLTAPISLSAAQVVSGCAGEENDMSFPFLKVWKGSPQVSFIQGDRHNRMTLGAWA